jgi:hypothetical protein
MKRLALQRSVPWAAWCASACSAWAGGGLSRWVEAMASEADRIVLATVTGVEDKPPGPRSATVKVLRS